jgi:hypothetical protein
MLSVWCKRIHVKGYKLADRNARTPYLTVTIVNVGMLCDRRGIPMQTAEDGITGPGEGRLIIPGLGAIRKIVGHSCCTEQDGVTIKHPGLVGL